MTPQDCTIVCLVRDEAPYLLEWVAWYRLLGARRLLFYDNDSTDGGSALLAALHAADVVVQVPWPDRTGRAPQLDAYADAIARCDTEWIGFLDADEFLVLPRHDGIPSFLGGFPESCGAVVVNQRVIGSNGQTHFSPGLVTERFPLGSGEGLWLNSWVKTLARTRCVAAPGIHCPTMREGDLLTANGDHAVIEDGQRCSAISHRLAYYNHYIIKSAEEYERKRTRGESNMPCELRGRTVKYSDAFFRAHDIAERPDSAVALCLPALRLEHGRLQRLLSGA
jgi:hypothetical protein